MILTQNTWRLRKQVAAHVAADQVVQKTYWENNRGCFIGCLSHYHDPQIAERDYGIPIMVLRIAERIFEALPAADAVAFFAALPDAVGCDGKDLSMVGWQFLAAELRSLPSQPPEVQAMIDPIVTGMDLLANGQEWPAAEAAADPASNAADDAVATTSESATNAASGAASAAVRAVAPAGAQDADVSALAAAAAALAAVQAAADAARSASGAPAGDAARDEAWFTAEAAANARQRDLLLRLITEAPVGR